MAISKEKKGYNIFSLLLSSDLSLRSKVKILKLKIKGIYYRLTGNKPILLIDQDEVLFECVEHVLKLYNIDYGTNHKIENVKNWDLTDLLGDDGNKYFDVENFCYDLLPTKDSVLFLGKIFESGRYDVHVVTAGDSNCHHDKIRSLDKWMPFVKEKDVIFCKTKHLIKGDVLLDDGPHNVEDYDKTKGLPVLYNRPFNTEMKGFLRINEWSEFYDFVEYLFYGKKSMKQERLNSEFVKE